MLALEATSVEILAVRGLGLIGLNDSLLRGALMGRALGLRVLLLHPDSEAARRRAAEIGEPAESLAGGIRVVEATLRELAGQGAAVEVYRYQTLPVWRLISIDGTLYVSVFDAGWEGHESPVYKIPPTSRGALYRGFRRMFDECCCTAERVV